MCREQPGSCFRLRLGFSPGLPRRCDLGVNLIHRKLVQAGLLGARPRFAKPFRRQVLFQNLQGILLRGDTPRRRLGFQGQYIFAGKFDRQVSLFSGLTPVQVYPSGAVVSTPLPDDKVCCRPPKLLNPTVPMPDYHGLSTLRWACHNGGNGGDSRGNYPISI